MIFSIELPSPALDSDLPSMVNLLSTMAALGFFMLGMVVLGLAARGQRVRLGMLALSVVGFIASILGPIKSLAMLESAFDSDARSEKKPTSKPNLPDFDWSSIGIGLMLGLGVLLGVIAVVLGIRRYKKKKAEARRKRQEREDKQERRNRASLQGVVYALESNLITLCELKTLEAPVLQERIDQELLNLIGESFTRVKKMVELLESYQQHAQLSPTDMERLRNARGELKQMYLAPREVQLKALGPTHDEIIAHAREENRTVRELPEG